MQVEYTDFGTVYTALGYSVAFEGEYACGEVSVGDTAVGIYERKEDGVCYFVRYLGTGKVQRIGQTEEDFERFAYALCNVQRYEDSKKQRTV